MANTIALYTGEGVPEINMTVMKSNEEGSKALLDFSRHFEEINGIWIKENGKISHSEEAILISHQIMENL